MPRPRRTWHPLALAVLLVLTALPAGAQEPPEPGASDWTVLEQKTGEGERCIVCKQLIYDKDVVEIRYQGRRFFVSADMLGQFEDDPLRYFAELQARAGLFDERAVGEGNVTTGWLVFGGWVVLGLVFAATCGTLAIARGHAPLPWFFAGLAGNVAALFVLLVSPRGHREGAPAGVSKVPATRAPVPCPECGNPNHPAARRCGGCGARLEPSAEAETARI